MTKPKKPEPNPIEEAIGDRAKSDYAKRFIPPEQEEPIPQSPEQILDEPSPSEMLTLEELNHQTEERLRDEPEQTTVTHTVPKAPIIPVSKPDPQPVTKTSSPGSPPQEIDEVDKTIREELPEAISEAISEYKNENAIGALDDLVKEEIPKLQEAGLYPPAEDIELTALKKYIREDGFVLATVAFHIVALCAQPMTTPSTTTWNYEDRAMVPDMVLALLNQPGYIEGIWPSLKVVMGSNKGNSAWCAGIATTIAFFDTIRVIPTLKELQIETEKKS